MEQARVLPPSEGLPPVDAEAVIAAVCAAYRLAPDAVRGRSRQRRLVHARCMASWLLRHRPTRSGGTRSFPTIGKLLGGVDHSSAIHRVSMAEHLALRDPVFCAKLRELAERNPIRSGDPASRLSTADLARIDHQTKAAIAEAARGAHRKAVDDAIARSRTKRGERVIEDDTDARNRASGSLLLAQAMLRARVAA